MNSIIPDHVEGHAAFLMHKYDMEEAVLYVNKPPCPKGAMRRYNLHKIIPRGSTLRVRFLDDDGVTVHEWIFRSGVEKWEELY